jgi:uncharacterized protein YcbX
MQLAEIWRYPVKSMAGEHLQSACLTADGIEGDRIVQVYDSRGRVATARTYPDLLRLHGTIGADGVPRVDGLPWTDPEVLAAVRKIVGSSAKLGEGANRFDILPLLVATDGAIAEFGRDGRRLRANLVIGGVKGLEERTWQGGRLMVGNAVIGIHDLRSRCIMTTYDPDTLSHDPAVLRDIVKQFGGKLALNCAVLRGGSIELGQTVEVDRV